MASASAEVHRVPETAQSGSPAIWPPPEPEPVKVKRDGVPLTEELIRRKAEHNEGMLSTLEEIALHQLDIDRIETLNSCRHLKIVYLQSNLIRKLENLHRLKELDYLNVALNNISKIENLEGCESLRKLDMTVNFVDLDHLHTVASLKNNTQLRELFLTGNPCAVHWESGYRDYVVATLPQLEQLDGKAILKAERIKAMQRLPDLERELALLAGLAKERKEEKADRRREKQRAIAAREMEDDEKEDWCIETRVEDARQLRETEEAKNEYRKKAQTESLFGDQAPRARRMFKDDGSIVQMNTAKWPFSIEEDGLEVRVDIALPKFLDSAQIDADVQPLYVRVTAKKSILQLLLPSEVLIDASKCTRSQLTGHLLLVCPKMHPIVVSKAPAPRKPPTKVLHDGRTGSSSGALLEAPPDVAAIKGANLTGAVDIQSIVAKPVEGQPRAKGALAQQKLGPDFDEEDDVPPLL